MPNSMIGVGNIPIVLPTSGLEDGAVTTAKLADGAVTDAKLAQTGGVLSNLGAYDVGTTYDTLDASYSRVMAIYPIRDVNDTFCFSIYDKSTNGTLSVRVTSSADPYSASLLQSVASLRQTDTKLDGEFTIDEAVKSSARYILVLNATANLEVSFTVELWTKGSIDAQLHDASKVASFLNDATMLPYTDFVQGGINGTTGVPAASNGTVRTNEFFNVSDIASVSLAASSGLHVQLYSYDASMTYLGRNDLGTNAFSYGSKTLSEYRSGCKFVTFAIYLDAGGSFSPSDLATSGAFSLVLTTISTVPNMNANTGTLFSDFLSVIGKTPMATWVDDDGVVLSQGGYGISNIVVPVADAVGIPVTFAVIPPLTDSVTVGGETMTRAEYFQGLQRDGHHVTAHPVHTHWYGNDYDLAEVNPSLIDCLTELQADGFLHSDMLVYPGGSGTNPAIVEIARKWCLCGVLSGYGTPNHLGEPTKWGIKRTFVNFEDYDSIHSSDIGYVSAMAWYKQQVDDAYANGDWIIFGTHSYQFTTSDDTTDPNANTLGNLQALMQYAADKGMVFRTLWDAYNRRRGLFDAVEFNEQASA